MGEIRKDNLHESLIEELNDLANIGLSGKQDKTDERLLTESKDLVGAINELFQSANNGKELIASAIGEPLDSNDTFSAMSNDINSLLSTFKTNMMNAGVTVESSDRFKSLIDKIATMVEEGSGKGIQFEMGTDTINIIDSGSEKTKTVSGLKFVPTYVFCFIQGRVWHEDDELDVGYTISNLVFGSMGDTYWDSGGGYFKVAINDNNSFTIKTYLHGSTYEAVGETPFTWYSIGVGEEDNTLRDSLASILQEEGVSVTEEDDMASLITKVDEEFDRQVVPAGDAVSSNVLSGKTFINSTGSTLTGTMTNRGGAQTVTPGTSNKTLYAGYYSGNITVAGDSDLVAANIVSGKNIFGVTGTATAASLGGKIIKTGTYTIPSEVGKNSGDYGDFYITVTADFGNVKPSRLFVFPSYIYARGTTHNYAVLDSSRHTTYSDSGATCILSEDGDTAWISGVTTTGFTVGFWKGGSNGYYTVSGSLGWLAIF